MSNSTAFNPFAVIEQSQDDIPEELAASCKKVFKKDVATRLKGLQEISSWIESSRSIDAFKDDFLRIYLEFSIDPDRQVRESVQKMLGIVIKAHRSFLKPLIKRIGPKWLGSLFDPVPSVSEISMSSFTELFKDDKIVAFCGLVEKELVQETLEASTGSLESLGERLKMMGEDRGNVNYSCDLYLHYLIRAIIFSSSKLEKPIESFFDMDLRPIVFKALDSLHGTPTTFLRQSLYRFLSACSTRLAAEKFYGRLDRFIGLLQNEQDGVSLVALIAHLQNLIDIGLIDTEKFRPGMLKFCSRLLAVCNIKVGDLVLKLLSKYYPDAQTLDSLERNFQGRTFVEVDHVKSFIELYVAALSAIESDDNAGRRQNLYKIVLEERLPLSALSLTYYLDLFRNAWKDDEFTNLLVGSLGKGSTKLLFKLPLASLWNNEKVQELCLAVIKSSPIPEVAKIIALIKNPNTTAALSNRFSSLSLTTPDAIAILKLAEKENISKVIDFTASKFESLDVEVQEEVLLNLEPALWLHLFKAGCEYSSLLSHLLDNDLKLAIQLSSIVPTSFHFNLQELADHFDNAHHALDENDCAALMNIFNASRDASNLGALISLAYDHGQEVLVPLLQNELMVLGDELRGCLVDICFSSPKVFSLVKVSSNTKAITMLAFEKLLADRCELQIESFIRASGFVLDNLSFLETVDGAHILAIIVLEVFKRLESDYLVTSLETNHRIGLADLSARISTCLCADVSFNDRLIENWIIGYIADTGLALLMLRDIPVSVGNLINIHSLLRCSPSESFKQIHSLGRFIPSTEQDIIASVYVIIGSDQVDATNIMEALPEDINADGLFGLTRVLAEENVSKKLSIRSDLLSYVLQRFKGDTGLKLKLISNTCHYGRINVTFWDHWTNDLTQSIDYALSRFNSCDDLDALKFVIRIACKYVNQESVPLAPYYTTLYDIWTKFGSTHQQCGIVKDITEMVSVIARQHVTNSFKTIDPATMLEIFNSSANINDLLVVRFFMALKIDATLEALKVEVAKQSDQKKLFPTTDLRKLFECEDVLLRKMLLVDIFMSYLEGASDAAGLADLYNEAFQEIAEKAIRFCLIQLVWETKTPFDLNKHEFVAIDSEEVLCSEKDTSFKIYAANLFARIVKSVPSAVRSYHANLPKESRILFERRFTNFMSPIMTARELSRLKRYEKTNPKDALKIKVLQTSTNCGVQAQYSLEDLSVELGLQVPSSFPLEPITVTGGKRLGISETKWRSWILSCQTVFKSDSINILDGLLHWKRNVEKSLEGMEPCPICYCIFHASDKTLPGPSCKTCNNKYHPSCLYKWFKSSGNATCPMCRAVF